MKKQIKFILVTLLVAFLVTLGNGNESFAKVKKIGKFKYNYILIKKGAWITQITPLSSRGIKTLVIPQKLEGKNVIKIGAKGDSPAGSETPNMFGVEYSRNDDGTYEPQKVYDRVKKIKKIRVPDTVKEMTGQCFDDIPDGKCINIPKSLVSDAIGHFYVHRKWDKLTVSPDNPKYKVKNSCLLSKNGKRMYGIVHKRNKISVPNTVTEIVDSYACNGAKIVVLSCKIKKIPAFMHSDNYVNFKVAKGNKKYASKYGCVYEKKTKKMVVAGAPAGILKIPEEVQYLDDKCGQTGKVPKKIICHSEVKELRIPFDYPYYHKKVTCVMNGKKPPRLLEKEYIAITELKVYVPKGCKNVYEKEWGNIPNPKTKLVVEEIF